MKNIISILAIAFALLSAGCKSESSTQEQTATPPEIVPEIQENRLRGEPTAFLSYAADSKINWQPWSPEILEHAQKARRMILVIIGSTRYNGCFETLEALERNPALVNRINQEFIPVLTDLDITRETGLIAYHLSSEARLSVAFPFIMLLSPEGAPVTWHTIQYTNDREIYSFFDNSLEVISRLWDDSPSYVKNDSSEKALMRIDRLPEPDEDVPEVAERQRRYAAAMRKIGSSYDDDLNAMAGSGGLFPFGLMDTLTLACHDQSLPESQRKLYRKTLDSFVRTLLNSAMVDILDGGLHTARRGRSWNLVSGQRDCSTQARAGRIFARMHQLGGSQETLETAINAVRFAEHRFLTPNGLFSLNEKPGASETKNWLWTIDQISSVLNEEEFKVWESFSDLNNIGNLPSEADPYRNFFRLNALVAARSPEEVAATTGFELEKVRALIESGRKKLLKSRNSRVPQLTPEPAPSAQASFRMASAYASLYAATKDASWLEKAINLCKESRKHFLGNRFLNERPDVEAAESGDGRAFTYAIAAQAGLDLGAVTLEDEWYSWAQDLSTLLAEHFVSDDGRLKEVREVSQVVMVDYEDRSMIFDNSTVGMVRLNLQRLKALGFQTPPSLSAWLTSVPPIDRFPVIFTDSMIAISHQWNHSMINVGSDASESLVNATQTLPLQIFGRRRVAAKGVKIMLQDDSEITANQPEDITSLIETQ